MTTDEGSALRVPFFDRSFSVEYHGDPIVFFAMSGKGWRYQCPLKCCRAWHWIDTESGNFHSLTIAADNRASITASLKCACYKGCTWHVNITNGVATDA